MTPQVQGAQSRALAARVVDAVLNDGCNLDAALDTQDIHALSERDRALVHALAYGTLRTQLRNRAVLDRLARKPFRRRDHMLLALLSTGLHALTDARTPDYAVVSATVAAAADLGLTAQRGFVNALLRRYLREQASLLQAVADLAEARWNHPQWLIDCLRNDWPDSWPSVLSANNAQAPMWLRVNLQQCSRDDYLVELQSAGLAATAPFPELSAAVQLETPVPVTQLPGFMDGACSVQDAASQLAAIWLAPETGMRVLDACAAPGGKAGHILEVAPDAFLFALDSSERRLTKVHENLNRLKLTATVQTGDAAAPDAWWDGNAFERILLDAPCSATGVIRRHPDIRFLRRPADIEKFAMQQRALLQSLWPLLRPGGRLLYATCSVLRAENEAVISDFLATTATARECLLPAIFPDSMMPRAAHGRQLLPGSGDTDGFYYALMERVAGD